MQPRRGVRRLLRVEQAAQLHRRGRYGASRHSLGHHGQKLSLQVGQGVRLGQGRAHCLLMARLAPSRRRRCRRTGGHPWSGASARADARVGGRGVGEAAAEWGLGAHAAARRAAAQLHERPAACRGEGATGALPLRRSGPADGELALPIRDAPHPHVRPAAGAAVVLPAGRVPRAGAQGGGRLPVGLGAQQLRVDAVRVHGHAAP